MWVRMVCEKGGGGLKKQGCLNGRGDSTETGGNQGGGRFVLVVCVHVCGSMCMCVYARNVPTHVFLFLS